MTCDECRQRWLDRDTFEPDGDELAEIKAHLLNCDDCRAAVREYGAIRKALFDDELADAGPDEGAEHIG